MKGGGPPLLSPSPPLFPLSPSLPPPAQALFRPVSMTVPDLALLCEVMLMAEGFQAARPLARKFVGLHAAAEGLLSPARHYDWKLRAIKTTLAVAGAARRAPGAAALGEARILLRALRDFNVGKLAADDAGVFGGLLEDLFPGLPATVPRGVDARFEAAVSLVFLCVWGEAKGVAHGEMGGETERAEEGGRPRARLGVAAARAPRLTTTTPFPHSHAHARRRSSRPRPWAISPTRASCSR